MSRGEHNGIGFSSSCIHILHKCCHRISYIVNVLCYFVLWYQGGFPGMKHKKWIYIYIYTSCSQIHDHSLSWLNKSIPLVHKYMTTHSPGLISRYHLFTNTWPLTLSWLNKSIPFVHKYMTTHSPGLISRYHLFTNTWPLTLLA